MYRDERSVLGFLMEHILPTAAFLVAVIGLWVYVSFRERGRRQWHFISAISEVLPEGTILEDVLFRRIKSRGDMRILRYFIDTLYREQTRRNFQGDPTRLEHSLYRGALEFFEEEGILSATRITHSELKCCYPAEYLYAKELGLLHMSDDAYEQMLDRSSASELNGLKEAITGSISKAEYERIGDHMYTLWELTEKGKTLLSQGISQNDSYEARCKAELALAVKL
jgi:hypothetical protein